MTLVLPAKVPCAYEQQFITPALLSSGNICPPFHSQQQIIYYNKEYAQAMKTLFMGAMLCILILFPAAGQADMTGAEAPEFFLQDIDGNIISLSRFTGSVLMLVHFNTYCHSCREEVARVNDIVHKYKNLRVVGIAIGNDREEVIEFKKKFKPAYDLVPDPQKQIYEKYFVRTVPLIDIIDRNGTIRFRGKLPAESELAPVIERAIAEKEAPVGVALWNRPPDFSLTNTDGETFHLYDSIGKKTITLTFLSIRNEGVKKAIEILKTVYSRYKREDLDIIRIAVGDTPEEVKKFREKYYVNYPMYVDENGEVAKRYGVAISPNRAIISNKVIIINKKGLIRYMQDEISLENLNGVLAKAGSYFREELPETLLMDYIRKAAPGIASFQKIFLGDGQMVFVGLSENREKIFVREVFKDVLCDVCTNVHFVYSFDLSGRIKNIVLIESIDLYGVPISADDYLQRVLGKAAQKLPLHLKKDVDALTGATQSCKLILEGINETPQILAALKTHQDTLGRIMP